MENIQNNTATVEDVKSAESGESTAEAGINTVETGEKTYTQKELENLIESRVARVKKQMPNKEEIEAFRAWKESQKTEAEKLAQKEQEYHQLVTEKENIKRENIVLKSGVNSEDADYVLFKVSKQDGEFEENLKAFLSENPKFLNALTNTVKNTGVIAKTTSSTDVEDGYLAVLRKKYPNVNFKE